MCVLSGHVVNFIIFIIIINEVMVRVSEELEGIVKVNFRFRR